ncbi:hypothetical protein [Heyndrickxia camelliae]|uniref:Uncharacterized protein n=1 Tax=Heyndrickxia camelliae TaxID=1707093 RepID=A0A2N3LE59_9BACI|nr:hypothetical protein [Heyndrickxia camelliae]PKR82879.1 hypothetical protein CWO92_22070 [Heyndrickxia camelliae]
MLQLLTNHKELKQIYTYNSNPHSSFDYANNLGYKQGLSSWNNDLFTPYLNKLINQDILTKVYDFVQNGQREALYQFSNGDEIELFGENHMNIRIFFNY